MAGGANAAVVDRDGRIFVAQNGGRHPARPVPGVTGGVQVVDPAVPDVAWVSRDMVASNDLCFGPDGHLYVTDPTRRPERDDGRIWRVSPATGEAELLCSVPWYPNGIAFGPDDALYVASTGERRIVRMGLTDGRAGEDATVCRMTRGFPDGLAFDEEGNLVVAAVSLEPGVPGSVQVWGPDGLLLECLDPVSDGHVTNVALRGNRLLVTASDSGRVLCADWPTRGLELYPFRAGPGAGR